MKLKIADLEDRTNYWLDEVQYIHKKVENLRDKMAELEPLRIKMLQEREEAEALAQYAELAARFGALPAVDE